MKPLEQLVNFGDVPSSNILFLEDAPTQPEMEKFFEAEVGKITL